MLLDDRVDTVTPRTMAMMAARPLVAFCSAALVALSFSSVWATIWLSGVAVSEVWTWFATTPQRTGRPARPLERSAYFASIVFMNLVWCSLGVLLWSQPDAAFKVAATCLLAAQIFHAQTFTAQSPAMLLVVGGFPAVTLLVMACAVGEFDFLDRVLVVGAVVILIAHTGRAAAVNAERDLQLESARRDAVAARDAQALFMSVVGHEIRTPMSGVLGMAEALKAGDLNADQSRKIEILIDSGQALMSLLDDLLDLSRLDANSFQFKNMAFDSRRLWDSADVLWRPLAERKGLAFSVMPGMSVPSALHGDPRRIAQIINNLTGNAIKFTRRGSVSVFFDWAEGMLTVRVRDTGTGLSAGDIARLFRPFVQVGKEDDGEAVRGTGLGLYVSEQLAKAMGGDLTVTGKPGEGAEFTLSLPVEASPDGPMEALQPSPPICARVLVVEDHPANQLIAQTLLHALGCESVVVDDGEAALEAVRNSTFDLVLMDLNLPGLDGAQTLAVMRDRKLIAETVPAIALTAEPGSRLMGAGFVAVLGKPLSATTLARALASALGR